MAQLVVAAAGAAIGFAIGGPTGAQIGWALGSMIAAPTQKVSGPRLSDLKVTGSEYGQPIPWVAGTPRLAGQIWWSSDRREVATTTSAGKGGGVESTTYTYEVDQLIGLTDRPIDFVARIWLNGRLVFTALTDADDDSITASNVTEAWSRITVYSGASDQLPDPTYEAAVGVGNAPAYRGRGSVFIEGLQLGSSGVIPNLTFEVVVDGTLTYVNKGLLAQFDELDVDGNFKSTLGPNFVKGASNTLETSTVKFGDGAGGIAGVGIELATPTPTNMIVGDVTGLSWRLEFWYRVPSVSIVQVDGPSGSYIEVAINSFSSAFTVGWAPQSGGGGGGAMGTGAQKPALNTWHHLAIQYDIADPRKLQLFSNGEYIGTFPGQSTAAEAFPGNAINRVRFDGSTGSLYDSTLYRWFEEDQQGDLYSTTTGYTVPTAPFEAPPYAYILVDPIDATLQETVEALCERAGMPAGTYDASALASITRPVRALAVASVSSIRSVLEQLATAYFFDSYASDKLYFVPRGGIIALTVDVDDMGAGEDQAAEEILPVTVGSDEEIPSQVALTYLNVAADYNTATEYSDRLISGLVTTAAVQLPLGLTAEEAKGIADAVVLDGYSSRISGELSLPLAYTRLMPTDIVTVTDADGVSYRVRLVRRTEGRVMLGFEWVVDDPSLLESAGITSEDYTPSITVPLASRTDLALMDIPILRDADDAPGVYAKMRATGGKWPGAQLLSSTDGVTYSAEGEVSNSGVIGVTTVFLTDWTGGNVFDEGGSVTVDVSNGTLSSATRDAVLDQEANAMLVGAEIIQFRTATLVTPGVYKLTALLRGRRGTEHAMTGHAVGEQVVLLSIAGMLRPTYDAAVIGTSRSYKAVTLGRSIDTATTETITDTGVALKPFAPANLRVDRSVDGLYTITWDRRTRYSYRWPGTTALPLGEASESYEADLLDLTDAVVETQTVTGAAVSFSTATRTITLDEGIGHLNTISGAYYGIQAEGSGLRYVLKIDSTGAVVATSFGLGDVSWCLRVNGGSIFVTGDALSSGTPQSVLSSTIYRIDPADVTTVAASYTMPTAGDAHGIWHDGTSLWVPGYVSGDLRELNGTTLASIGATPLEVGIWAITGDGTYLFLTNIDTGDVFAYDPGVGEVWRVTPGSSPFDILVRSGFVYVACADRVVVLNAADGTTVATHTATITSASFTPTLVSFGAYVCFKRTSGFVAFIDAATGDIEFESSIPAITYLSGADGSTLFTIASPTLSFTNYETWGYELNSDLAGFTVNVYQVSATVGRGYPATITL